MTQLIAQTQVIPKTPLYLIDGSGFIFRAFHALPPLTRPDGTPVGAVLGFVNMLMRLVRDQKINRIAVIFDAARRNFRNDIYPAYKANRDATPPDLIPQFPLIRDATRAFGIPAIELDGFEADDLIATYARLALEAGDEVVIVSSDKDLMQLIRNGVSMMDPIKQTVLGPDAVFEKFGVTPDKVVDIQALAGDATDNVPGVPGIGVKTAAQLITEYGDLETLLAHAGEIKQPKRREALLNHANDARMSLKLVTLDAYAPIDLSLDEIAIKNTDMSTLTDFLGAQNFKSALSRLGAPAIITSDMDQERPRTEGQKTEAKTTQHYKLIQSVSDLQPYLDAARAKGMIAIDTETTGLTPAKADLVGISLCVETGQACYIPIAHNMNGSLLEGPRNSSFHNLKIDDVFLALKSVLEDPSILKIGQNIKYDLQMFSARGINVSPVDDTMLLSYVLSGAGHGHGMDNLADIYCNHKMISYDEVTGTGKNRVRFDDVPIDRACTYAAEDADFTMRVHAILKPRLLQERMVSVYEDIERPIIPVIAQMEHTGIRVDTHVLQSLSADFGNRMITLEKDIHAQVGHPFNIGSPKQLGQVLFEEMGLQGSGKTKTGDWSTSADVLEDLAAQGHKIVAHILDWRQMAKLKSTYTDALLEQINPRTGRVHTSFALTATSTGRLASSDPNLQNIPIRTEEGRKIRKAFIADNDCVLISVDYSQIELRLAAEMAGIEALKDAFRSGEDIHAATASKVFGVPLANMTPDIRRQAKAINFGIIYGISGYGLAQQLGVDNGTASTYIKQYFARFPELADFMEKCKSQARADGFVRTLFGRKCAVPNINHKQANIRSFAERQAINAPLQGTAADLIKIAMGQMPQALQKAGLEAKLLLQVHDELVFEAPEKQAQETAACIKSVMENVTQLSIPLIAQAGIGKNWGSAH